MNNVAADALSGIHENNHQLGDASCYNKWCEDVSFLVYCIQHNDVKALLMGCLTGDQHHIMDAMMAAYLNRRESTVPVPYGVASGHDLRVVRDWPVIQNKNSDIRKVKNIISDGTILSKQSYRMLSADAKLLLRRLKDIYIEHDILKVKGKYGGRIVVNGTELPLLMICYHEGQRHLGEDRTVDLIESRFFSPNMRMSIVEAVKKYHRCALMQTLPAKNKTSMGHLRIHKHPFDIVSMDHVSIDNRATGTHTVITVVDHFTKYV